MLKKSKYEQMRFVTLLRRIIIMPYRINLGHYFAFTNNWSALSKVYSRKGKVGYITDQKGKFPLQYAIKRKSQQCASKLINYIINVDQNIFSKFS
mmetsp:Transcript_13961/g.10064  ORF Transcript_13961/g.10064 Transcript_13961/m.10064 type:complete len:95 (+) Transcript_13961:391-675(+)